ncbi:MAG: hypothetical protein K6A35_05665 [bacterium]|nr:hypothetical protein [bacterium]
MRGVLSFFINMENMDVSKIKITTKEALERALDGVWVNCWLSFPWDRNLSFEENRKKYDDYVYDTKIKTVAAKYDICLDEEKDAINNSEHK